MLKTSLNALEVLWIILDHTTDDFSRVMADSIWPLAFVESYFYTWNMSWGRNFGA